MNIADDFTGDIYDFTVKKINPNDKIIALAGNPNVGKSTVFNALTGMRQHTGNWAGKTVKLEYGNCNFEGKNYILADLPGTYSLMAHSADEETARDFLCFGGADAVVVVCDATCLERNMNLVLQIMELTPHVVVCVNLMDEAKKKNIKVDLKQLSQNLGVPVVGTAARGGKGLTELMRAVEKAAASTVKPLTPHYNKAIEAAIAIVEPCVEQYIKDKLFARWVALRLLDYDDTIKKTLEHSFDKIFLDNNKIAEKLAVAHAVLAEQGLSGEKLRDSIVACILLTAESVCGDAVIFENDACSNRDRALDRIFTSRATGIPVMLILLGFIFWLTIAGANYPSQMLSKCFFWLQQQLSSFFLWVGTPQWLHDAVVLGVYRVLAWVVAVMLPPMAIFFPLFTLLEDLGYLPRVAFNLDNSFKKCSACGKQALSMCMGFGCNAAGVVGARIIDSPRERLIAIITNTFVPCNGRFPMIIAVITIFFAGSTGNLGAALILTAVIVFSVLMTFAVSKILSKTILRGLPSSFTLELPPYRRPQIGRVIVRSFFDRTFFVLGRAVAVAAPAGLIIWLCANINIEGVTLLAHCSALLEPLGRLMGLDGVILMGFILGFPANEIVLPVIVMAYLSNGSIAELNSLIQLREVLVSNGWTWLTAVCMVVFSLMHWPCSTTVLTIKKETGSFCWAAVAFLVPTAAGFLLCAAFAGIVRLLGLI
ncbi:MAG: ferrous iron transport protein B [Hydrogenoanaerobacterium sp.]